MSDLPVPKFKIGQRVFYIVNGSTKEQLPCPDCLGSRKWKVTTPAGVEMETNCLRCSSQYFSGRSHIPSLDYFVHSHSVRSLTIGSIRMDTGDTHNRSLVSYMCIETGIGSGSIYYEPDLLETEEAAHDIASIKDRTENAELAKTPERLEAQWFADLKMNGALYEGHHSQVWSAWYSYRSLYEAMEELLEGEPKSIEADALREQLRSERRYGRPPELGMLLAALQNAVETNSTEELKTLLDAFPDLRAIAAEKEFAI